VIVAIARGAIVGVAAAIVVGGCRGGEEREQVFRPADAARIANVRPVMPGWTWPQNPEKHCSSCSQAEAQPTEPLLVELKRQTADTVSFGDAGNKWRDAYKGANLYADVLASAADAHKVMAPFNAFSRGWAERTGRITKDEEIEGLGDEAWLLRAEVNGTPEVTYHWRRGNLVVEAHVYCFRLCPGDVEAATRAWVDAIDEEARARS
jgi:hypothetical protein